MKTLLTIMVLYTVIGWSLRLYYSNRGKCSLNPFNDRPSSWAIILLISTWGTAALVLGLMLRFLP
jgi:hypothetical protein